MDAVIVISTWPDETSASAATRILIGERLIACGNLLPTVKSIYLWKGGVEEGAETMLIMKTERARIEQVRARIVELHSYEVPEIIVVPIAAGHEPYLRWINECVS